MSHALGLVLPAAPAPLVSSISTQALVVGLVQSVASAAAPVPPLQDDGDAIALGDDRARLSKRVHSQMIAEEKSTPPGKVPRLDVADWPFD
jgi:hypothetical protein